MDKFDEKAAEWIAKQPTAFVKAPKKRPVKTVHIQEYTKQNGTVIEAHERKEE